MTRGLAVLLCALLAACSEGDAKQKKDEAKAAPAAVPVTVLEVAPREVPISFEAVGRTEGSREVQVRARVSGILEKQLYNEGDSVAAGAPPLSIRRAPLGDGLPPAPRPPAPARSRGEPPPQEHRPAEGPARP